MAKYLDTNVNPDDVTVDNISSYNKLTADVITLIRYVDMTRVSTGIAGLLSYKLNSLSIRHLKDTEENRPSTAVSGTVFFIKKE